MCPVRTQIPNPIGAHENSEWSDGKLVIAGNRANIHLLQAAFYAVKLELRRRNIYYEARP
jgi:hypothetical protein